jgi:methionyl-tRNA formyltransferase
MLKKENGLLDFDQPAVALERQVRAYSPWPGAYFIHNGTPLKVQRASVASGQAGPGTRITVQGNPAIGTSDGLLVLEELQPAGKKSMPGKAFLSGARDWL